MYLAENQGTVTKKEQRMPIRQYLVVSASALR